MNIEYFHFPKYKTEITSLCNEGSFVFAGSSTGYVFKYEIVFHEDDGEFHQNRKYKPPQMIKKADCDLVLYRRPGIDRKIGRIISNRWTELIFVLFDQHAFVFDYDLKFRYIIEETRNLVSFELNHSNCEGGKQDEVKDSRSRKEVALMFSLGREIHFCKCNKDGYSYSTQNIVFQWKESIFSFKWCGDRLFFIPKSKSLRYYHVLLTRTENGPFVSGRGKIDSISETNSLRPFMGTMKNEIYFVLDNKTIFSLNLSTKKKIIISNRPTIHFTHKPLSPIFSKFPLMVSVCGKGDLLEVRSILDRFYTQIVDVRKMFPELGHAEKLNLRVFPTTRGSEGVFFSDSNRNLYIIKPNLQMIMKDLIEKGRSREVFEVFDVVNKMHHSEEDYIKLCTRVGFSLLFHGKFMDSFGVFEYILRDIDIREILHFFGLNETIHSITRREDSTFIPKFKISDIFHKVFGEDLPSKSNKKNITSSQERYNVMTSLWKVKNPHFSTSKKNNIIRNAEDELIRFLLKRRKHIIIEEKLPKNTTTVDPENKILQVIDDSLVFLYSSQSKFESLENLLVSQNSCSSRMTGIFEEYFGDGDDGVYLKFLVLSNNDSFLALNMMKKVTKFRTQERYVVVVIRLLSQTSDSKVVLEHLEWLIPHALSLINVEESLKEETLLNQILTEVLCGQARASPLPDQPLLEALPKLFFKDDMEEFYEVEILLPLLEKNIFENESRSYIYATQYSCLLIQFLKEEIRTLPKGYERFVLFNKNPGSEPKSIGKIRKKLIHFLWSSDYYDAKIVYSRLIDVNATSMLFQERVICNWKLGDHKKAIKILLSKIRHEERLNEYLKKKSCSNKNIDDDNIIFRNFLEVCDLLKHLSVQKKSRNPNESTSNFLKKYIDPKTEKINLLSYAFDLLKQEYGYVSNKKFEISLSPFYKNEKVLKIFRLRQNVRLERTGLRGILSSFQTIRKMFEIRYDKWTYLPVLLKLRARLKREKVELISVREKFNENLNELRIWSERVVITFERCRRYRIEISNLKTEWIHQFQQSNDLINHLRQELVLKLPSSSVHIIEETVNEHQNQIERNRDLENTVTTFFSSFTFIDSQQVGDLQKKINETHSRNTNSNSKIIKLWSGFFPSEIVEEEIKDTKKSIPYSYIENFRFDVSQKRHQNTRKQRKNTKESDNSYVFFGQVHSLDSQIPHGVGYILMKKKKKKKKSTTINFNLKKKKKSPTVAYYPIFEGNFLDGKMNGSGIEYANNVESSSSVILYEGQFRDNLRHGRGVEYLNSSIMTTRTTTNDDHHHKNKNNGNSVREGIWKKGIFVKKIVEYDFQIYDDFTNNFEKQLIPSNQIGIGGNGVVYQIKLDRKDYAAKIFDLNCFSSIKKKYLKMTIRRSLRICASLRHPNIIQVYGMIEGPLKVGVLMELMDSSLDKYIFQNLGKMKILDKIKILYETSLGMEYLHKRGIINRDLKWGNVLISKSSSSSNIIIKLTDFDTAKQDESNWKFNAIQTKTGVGTSVFLAPEVLTGVYSLPIDVYSFGMMIFCILFETINPYSNSLYVCNCGETISKMNPIILPNHVKQCGLRPRIDPLKVRKYLPSEYDFLIQLMILCWSSNVKERPSFSQICDILDECIQKKMSRNEEEEEGEEEEEEMINNEKKRRRGVTKTRIVNIIIKGRKKRKKEEEESSCYKILVNFESLSTLCGSIEKRWGCGEIFKIDRIWFRRKRNEEKIYFPTTLIDINKNDQQKKRRKEIIEVYVRNENIESSSKVDLLELFFSVPNELVVAFQGGEIPDDEKEQEKKCKSRACSSKVRLLEDELKRANQKICKLEQTIMRMDDSKF